MASTPSESTLDNPRSGLRTFQVLVGRLVLRTVAIGAAIAAILVAIAHVYLGTGTVANWAFLAAAMAVSAISWREAKRHEPRPMGPLIIMLVVIVSRLMTADLFVAVSLLIPLLAVGLMGAFSLADKQLRLFTVAFAACTAPGVASFVVRFDATGVWRGMVAAGVGAGLGIALVALLRRENVRFVARYESLYDGVSIGLVRFSVDGNLIAANRQMTRMLGYASVADFAAGNVQSILFDSTEIDSAVELVRSGEQGELKLRHRSGDPIWTRVTFGEVADSQGDLIGYEGFVEDVTERRLARESAQRAEERFLVVFESAPIGMALVGTDGGILRANRAFGALAGFDGPVPSGTPWVGVLDGRLGNPARFFEPDQSGHDAEIEVPMPGGSRSLRVHAERPSHGASEAGFAIVQLLDVTSDVELRAVLREQVRLKNDFLATVSHELRTPLTAVVGFLSEIPSALGEIEAEPAEMLEIVASEATALSNIVEDLLVAARADLDQLTVRSEVVQIKDVVDRVVRASSRIVRDHGVSVDTDAVAAELVVGDEGRVEQILWNLVMNAVRHGGAQVTLGTTKSGDTVVTWVRDNGPGMLSDRIDAVFEPFRSFPSEQGVTTSMGLGLHVVHTLVQRMGGSVEVDPEPGRTEFRFELPAAVVAIGDSA